MSPTREQGPASRSEGGKAGAPIVPTLVLFLVVGALAWIGERPLRPTDLVIENASGEARTVDVVWKTRDGVVFGSLLRLIEPSEALHHPLRGGVVACVRWIDPGAARVEAVWSVPGTGADQTVVLPGSGSAPDGSLLPCEPELAEHRIRPRLGAWMPPGDPTRMKRERIISRVLHRRTARRRSVSPAVGAVTPSGASPWDRCG